MKKIHLAFGLALSLAFLWASSVFADNSDLKKSVVKIFTVTNKPNYYQPWVLGYQFNASGSGCVLSGKRILTNAHVISDEVFIQVMKAGDTKKYTAEVESVDHDREVAVLKVKDPEFFEGTIPVQFGDLPAQRDKVAVYGFPVGGDELSITEGVVSRIEVQTYVHSQRSFLALQTDAAINPGNSGGPAFQNGKMIGLAFQAFGGDEAQNTGYIVPIPIIRKSLEDLKKGNYEGAPALGIHWEKMESPAMRACYKLAPRQTGVLVTKVLYQSPAWELMKPQDVLVSIDGVPIANNGTIRFRKDERLNFSYLISLHSMGDKMRLGVIRDGQAKALEATLKSFQPLVAGPQYDVRPSYYIYGGFVFMPLTADYLGLWKSGTIPSRFANYYENESASAERKQVVFINEVLPHDLNVGYHDLKQAIVASVNGRPISEMKDLIEAFRHPMGKFDVIELENDSEDVGGWVVIEAKNADKDTQEILKTFGIDKDRSEDLDEEDDSQAVKAKDE